MKNLRRTIAGIVTMALVITTLGIVPLTASAKNAEDYHLLSSTFNTKTVYNGPTEDASFNIDKDTMLQAVTTYHWNNGQGKAPGSISLLENGVKVGEWQATGRASSGVNNTLWDVFPDYVLKGGNYYTIVDSDNDTWSYNSESYDIGFVEIRGYGMDSGTSANSNKSSSTSYDFISSDWAAQEVISAIDFGIVPSNLLTADLTRSIDRHDFAVMSLYAYEHMSGDKVVTGANPFLDTGDTEVVKAYNAGIIAGTSDTTFSPNDLLTREQAAAMLTRAYKKTIYSGWTLAGDDGFLLIYTSTGSFDDSYQISDYARGSVDFMASKGVISGMGDGTFAPKSTVTREQAIAIAVRMLNNLDTTPQENTGANQQNGSEAKSGEAQSASGTVNYDDVHITFGSGNSGEVVMTKDGNETVMGVTEEPSTPVSISIDADALGADEEYVIEIGIPYTDSDEETGFYWANYDASYSDGRATAQVNMSDFDDVLESIDYDNAKGKAYKRNNNLLSSKLPSGKTYKNGCKIRIKKTITQLSSDGHFKVRIAAKFTDKLGTTDAKNIGNDLEEIMQKYKTKGFDIKYSSWPMSVYGDDLGNENSGVYIAGLGYMNINLNKISGGYKGTDGKYKSGGESLYSTMTHEFFHCIERGYVSKVFESRWFDEACAAYYETVFANEKNISDANNAYIAASTDMHQFKGVVPQYVSLASLFWDGERGYGRKPVIEYLQKTAGDSFIRKVYEEGGTWTQSGISDYIVKHSGKSLAEIAKGFYTELLTTSNLDANYQDPWNIWQLITTTDDMKEVASKVSLNGKENTSIGYTISPYGAHLMKLELGKVSAQYGTFNVKLNTSGQSCIVIAMDNGASEYKYYYSANGVTKDIPITAKKYLIAIINETDSSYSGGMLGSEANLGVTFNNAFANISTWASTEDEIKNIPTSYSGTVTYAGQTAKKMQITTTSNASIRLNVSLSGSASISVTSADGSFNYSNSDLTYSSSTGICSGNGVSVQLEPVGFGEMSILRSLGGTGVRVHVYEGDNLIAVATGNDGGVDIGRAPEEHDEATVAPSN